jgi:hypothetical protein
MEFVFIQTAEKDVPSPFQLIEFSLRELFGAGGSLVELAPGPALLDQYANLHRIDLAQAACMLQ